MVARLVRSTCRACARLAATARIAHCASRTAFMGLAARETVTSERRGGEERERFIDISLLDIQ